MTTKPIKNVGKSVFERLKNQAKAQQLPVDYLFERYLVERLLFRLSQSSYRDALILKGGTLLLAWSKAAQRVTRDVDFLSPKFISLVEMKTLFAAICTTPLSSEDGVHFLAETIIAEEIRKDAHYAGIRVQVEGRLDSVKKTIQIDIGFGDVVTPQVDEIAFPSLLAAPFVGIKAYPRYTVIAEKFEAIVSLGIANSRLKDFYDIWLLSGQFSFEAHLLGAAIKNTFQRRRTDLPTAKPSGLTAEFYNDPDKQKQWKNSKFSQGRAFPEVIQAIEEFLMPLAEQLTRQTSLQGFWDYTQRLWVKESSPSS